MKTLNTVAVIGALTSALLSGSTASAQSKTIPGESITRTVTIEAIDQVSRTFTVKNEKGIHETLVAPPEITRFNELKVGDKIVTRYYDNVVVRMKKPGEAAVDVDAAALTKSTGGPGGTAAAQRTITVTVTAKDPAASSVTVKGPNEYVYSRRVSDKKAFDTLKVGDQLDMTWTQAVVISVEPVK